MAGLFDPLRIKGLELRNRIVFAPVVTNFGLRNERAINFFAARSRGGVGLIIVHGTPVDLLIKTGTENRPDVLNKYPWPARDPNGRINIESMLDMQAWYDRNKMSNANFPADRLVQTSYVQEAAQKLGPFVLENKDSKLSGCR